MSEFEFVFPLFALLVGLSMTEMLSGLAYALKSKRDIRVGWLTPLLGTIILLNLAMFWQGSWEIRHGIAATSASLVLVLAVGGCYYLASSLVFPSFGSEVSDLDEHFMEIRRIAMLAIAACNLVYFARIAMISHDQIGAVWWIANLLFLGLLLIVALASDRRLILAALWTVIASHILMLLMR
jgi:hypothetical protein